MRRVVQALVAGVLLAAAGFAAASIASGQSFSALLTGTSHTGTGHVTTGHTGTGMTGTTPMRRVTICHRTHSKKHPFVTITVSQHAVRSEERRVGKEGRYG